MLTWYQNLRTKTCSLRLRAFTPGLTPGVLSPISDSVESAWARCSTHSDRGYDSVGQANAALTPFGGLPGEPSGSGSEIGASDLVELVLRGVDSFRFILRLGPRSEGRHHHRCRSSEFLSALRRPMPGQERAEVCRACAAVFGTSL